MNATHPRFSTAQFELSHGRKPRGRGGWAFADASSDGVYFAGAGQTLAEAQAEVAAAHPEVKVWIVLP